MCRYEGIATLKIGLIVRLCERKRPEGSICKSGQSGRDADPEIGTSRGTPDEIRGTRIGPTGKDSQSGGGEPADYSVC